MTPWRIRWTGIAMGCIFSVHVLAELFRPKFVPVNAESAVIEHVNSPIVSVLHLLMNVVVIVPALWAAYYGRSDLRRVGIFAVLSIALLVVVTISLSGIGGFIPLSYILLLGLALASAAIFSATDYARAEGMRDALATTAIGCGLALAIAIGLGEYAYGRLASRAGPTFWGMVAIMCFSLAVCVPYVKLRAALMLMALTTTILASARGAMVSCIVAAIVMVLVTMKRSPATKRTHFLAAFVILMLLIPLAGPYIANNVFDMSDPRRGVGSGATGRAEAWAQAFQLFLSHPFFGVGYRQHEQYITVATSAHQAYLAVLAELGATGFLIYIVLLIGALARQTRRALRRRDNVSLASAAFLWGFAMIGFSENLALATGLAMPAVMIFIAADAWRDDRRSHRTRTRKSTPIEKLMVWDSKAMPKNMGVTR